MTAVVGEIRGRVFHLPVRVYYEDTDAGGVVYYANYLKYLERARTEWLRAAGWDQSSLEHDAGLLFAVRSLEVEYIAPARLDDWLDVEAQVVQVGRASVSFDQLVGRRGTELCHARVRVACLDATTFKPRALPATLREVFVGAN
jgi:acyl-CoA thioester hydrolase